MALSRNLFVHLVSAASLLVGLACQVPGTTASSKPEPFVPTLSLRPVTVTLGTGATQPFQAELAIPRGIRHADIHVGWRVLEPEGGAITADGVYTAPATPGVYHVQVRWEDYQGVTALATVTVK